MLPRNPKTEGQRQILGAVQARGTKDLSMTLARSQTETNDAVLRLQKDADDFTSIRIARNGWVATHVSHPVIRTSFMTHCHLVRII